MQVSAKTSWQAITMNTSKNPLGRDLNRRHFIKKSALSVGALSVLGQGIGIADPEASYHHTCPPHKCNDWVRKEHTLYTMSDDASTGPFYQLGTCKCINSPHSQKSRCEITGANGPGTVMTPAQKTDYAALHTAGHTWG
jgi:hypothetical protein